MVYYFCANKKGITTTKEGRLIITAASLFSQLPHHFPRTEFADLVTKHQAERRAKGYSGWSQLVDRMLTLCVRYVEGSPRLLSRKAQASWQHQRSE